MYIVNMASGCTLEDASCVSLDDLGNISILLNEENYLKEKILIYLMKYFYFQV